MSSTRKSAAIMFADMVGYTALMESDEDLAFEALKKTTKSIQDSSKSSMVQIREMEKRGVLDIE